MFFLLSESSGGRFYGVFPGHLINDVKHAFVSLQNKTVSGFCLGLLLEGISTMC